MQVIAPTSLDANVVDLDVQKLLGDVDADWLRGIVEEILKRGR